MNITHPPRNGLPVAMIRITEPTLQKVGAKYWNTSLKNSGSDLSLIFVVFSFIYTITLLSSTFY